jgi:hypothetical protein
MYLGKLCLIKTGNGEVVGLNRLERFRKARITKRKYTSVLLLSLALLVLGLGTVDYAVNSIMKNVKSISIVSVKHMDSYIELSFLNKKLYLNTCYINEDLKKLKEAFQKKSAIHS